MKIVILTLVSFCSLGFLGYSQGVTLTFDNTGYIPGYEAETFIADTNGISHGNEGQNISWDFSILNITATKNVIKYINASSTQYSALFPTATVAYSDGPGNVKFFQINNSEFNFLGEIRNNESLVYSDPQINLTYPFKYNDQIIDTFFCSYEIVPIKHTITGIANIKADGWGTLKLPLNSFDNVVRIKYDISLKDSSFERVIEQFTKKYMWYDGIHKVPLLEIAISYGSLNGVPIPIIKKTVRVSKFINGLSNDLINKNALNIFPNPANLKTFITFNLHVSSEVKILIYNLSGKIEKSIKYQNLSPGLHKEILPLFGILPGLYFISVEINGVKMVQKLFID